MTAQQPSGATADGRRGGDENIVGKVTSSPPARVMKEYGNASAGNYAAGLAFNAFMSMFPLILGLLAILGLAIRDPQTQETFENAVLGFFPADAHGALSATLTGVRQHAGILGIIGILGLLWSGSSLFSAMEFALGQMFGVGQRDFLRQKLMALTMTGVFVVAIVASVVVNSVMRLLPGLAVAGPVVGALVWIAFTLVLYRFVPSRTYGMRDLLVGAAVAGILMEILTLLWPLYTGLSHGFNTYGSTFALFFLLATWLYFLSQFILLGAVIARMRAGGPAREGVLASTDEKPVETDGTVGSGELSGRPQERQQEQAIR